MTLVTAATRLNLGKNLWMRKHNELEFTEPSHPPLQILVIDPVSLSFVCHDLFLVS